jgi:hypothetical protein
MQFAATARRDVLVRDIMQKDSEWLVADIRQIERATVATVAETFAKTGLTHIPVMETSSQTGEQRLRGLLSGAKVKRVLARPQPHAA